MVSLHTETIGSGPRIVLVHGFTQNGRCWEPLASLLAASHEVILVDAPGHGLSGHDDADLSEAGQLILEAGSGGGPSSEPVPATYVGYSMGARMLLYAALNVGAPRIGSGSDSVAVSAIGPGADLVAGPGDGLLGDGLIERLVLIGATAGLDSEVERVARREADEELAAVLEVEGLESFLDRWLAMPMFAGLSAESAAREERMSNRAEGLASSLRHCGTGTQKSLWGRLSGLSMPVSVAVGAGDQKFGPLASRLVSAIGSNATKVEIPGGHAVHLESPELLLPYLKI